MRGRFQQGLLASWIAVIPTSAAASDLATLKQIHAVAGVATEQQIALPPIDTGAVGLAQMAQATVAAIPVEVTMRGGMKRHRLFRKLAPAVVMLESKAGKGTGTIINRAGDILTSWHVVGDARVLTVYRKPEPGRTVRTALLADVIKSDAVADLALIRLRKTPPRLAVAELPSRLRLARTKMQVGFDVHLIGHPHGEGWTYAAGVISQVHDGYEWAYENTAHKANVFQTQAPINPGSSGGPVFNDQGRIVGVVLGGATDSDRTNYAISHTEVRRFLNRKANRLPLARKAKAVIQTVRAVDQDDDGKPDLWQIDRNGNGIYERVDFDQNKDGRPDAAWIDFDENGAPETYVFDTDLNGKYDVYKFDHDEDGTIDEVGYDTNEDGHIDFFDLAPGHP